MKIPIVKVRSNSEHGPEFTWEREAFMKSKYPHLFTEESSACSKQVPTRWWFDLFDVSGSDSPPFSLYAREGVVGSSCSSCRLEKDPHKAHRDG
ncbi:hypothetical protein OSB04_028350 [Centaurea solstitialis]|uniref:Uncharacterized protein n=1 Tax=Centaurea solstitialis TaxID=347529 RepID=A0AA38SFC7_9ASTR|nr:hypothetical protein OSB04_028350 [Centaurea solstitialis]